LSLIVKKIHSQIDENMAGTSWRQASLLYPTFPEDFSPFLMLHPF